VYRPTKTLPDRFESLSFSSIDSSDGRSRVQMFPPLSRLGGGRSGRLLLLPGFPQYAADEVTPDDLGVAVAQALHAVPPLETEPHRPYVVLQHLEVAPVGQILARHGDHMMWGAYG